MKLNLKIIGILLILTIMVISAANAVELAGNFSNEKFEMNIPSECNLSENVNLNDDNTSLLIFKNTGKNSEDVNSILYIQDSKLSENNLSEDLQFLGDKVEESDKYTIFKNSDNPFGFKFGFDSEILSDFGNSLSSSLNKLTLPDNTFDVDGAYISISENGLSISDKSNHSINTTGDLDDYLEIEDSDYSVVLKNTDNNALIVILGDDVELLKSIADTTLFNEN